MTKRKSNSYLTALLLITLIIVVVGTFGFLSAQKSNKTETKTSSNISQNNLAELDNSSLGYKFSYPAGWQVLSSEDIVTVSAPSFDGQIKVGLKDGIADINVEDSKLSGPDKEVLNLASKYIKDSFVLTEKVEYDPQEMKKRFAKN